MYPRRAGLHTMRRRSYCPPGSAKSGIGKRVLPVYPRVQRKPLSNVGAARGAVTHPLAHAVSTGSSAACPKIKVREDRQTRFLDSLNAEYCECYRDVRVPPPTARLT